jgi:hypothetical protein
VEVEEARRWKEKKNGFRIIILLGQKVGREQDGLKR